jgi:hypothetical protein
MRSSGVRLATSHGVVRTRTRSNAPKLFVLGEAAYKPARRPESEPVRDGREIVMFLILLIVVLVLLFGGGGGYYGYRRWGTGGGIGIVGMVAIILLFLYLFGGLRL